MEEIEALQEAKRGVYGLTFGDAQVAGPCTVRLLPAAIYMIQPRRMLEIRPIDGKLVVRVQHALHGKVAVEGVCGVVFEDEHSVIESWASEN